MRYFVMKSTNNEMSRRCHDDDAAEIRKTSDLSPFREMDYIGQEGLVSDRLKLLIELYMPKYNFTPVVYLDVEKQKQLVFWKFNPRTFTHCQASYRNCIMTHISFTRTDVPLIFSVQSKGNYSIVVHMAVAESAFRRGILGLKFTALIHNGLVEGERDGG